MTPKVEQAVWACREVNAKYKKAAEQLEQARQAYEVARAASEEAENAKGRADRELRRIIYEETT